MSCFFEATPPLIRFESLVVSTFCFPTFNLLTLTLFPFVLFFVVAIVIFLSLEVQNDKTFKA